jgi:hypothetical protein
MFAMNAMNDTNQPAEIKQLLKIRYAHKPLPQSWRSQNHLTALLPDPGNRSRLKRNSDLAWKLFLPSHPKILYGFPHDRSETPAAPPDLHHPQQGSSWPHLQTSPGQGWSWPQRRPSLSNVLDQPLPGPGALKVKPILLTQAMPNLFAPQN